MQELIQGWIPPWIGKVSWRGKWQPTPVFFPGKSHGQKSLVGSMGSRVGHNWATKQQQIVFPWKCFLFPAQKVDFLGSLFSFLVWVLHMACWEQKQKPNNWLLQKCNLYIYMCVISFLSSELIKYEEQALAASMWWEITFSSSLAWRSSTW